MHQTKLGSSLAGIAVNFLVILSGAAAASAQPSDSPRSEVEIRFVPQPNGTPSFAVPLRIGGQEVIAGLDTGSGGLRLLPAAQHDLRPTDGTSDRRYGYGTGIVLTGPAMLADVAFGAVRGNVKVQAVRQVGCVPNATRCLVGERPIDQDGFFGNKLPNRGFKAILGAIPNPEGNIVNPWIELGVRRWIISVPRPGEQTGRLILNPAAADMAGFRMVPSGAKPWQIATCVSRRGPQPTQVCGTNLMDTGAAPDFQIVNAEKDGNWRPGTPLVLELGRGDADDIRLAVRIGEDRQGMKFGIGSNVQHPGITILSGAAVYYACDVMWDAERQQISLRVRPPYPGGAVAEK